MTTTTMTPKQQEIVELAYGLFRDGGYHTTGVDALMAGSGISKRTLYKYFPTKEHLIEAVLAQYGHRVEDAIVAPALACSADPRSRILAMFDVRRDAMDKSGCTGCMAMKAAQEYRGRHAGIEAAGREAVEMLEALFAKLCTQAELADPALTGRQLALLMQGAVLTSQVRDDTEVFAAARRAAEQLIGH